MGRARSGAAARRRRARYGLLDQRRDVGPARTSLLARPAGGDPLRRRAVHHALDGGQRARDRCLVLARRSTTTDAEAANLHDAVVMAKGCPGLSSGGSVELSEAMSMG